MPEAITVGDWIGRLVVATVLSGFIGFERESRQKAAGLRTHMLIGLGACLFTLVSATAFEGGDPSRIAAQIVSGVGFLGAGAIFRAGASVRGLTTAAGIWAVAAIGTTAGTGLLVGALIATVISVVVLSALPIVDQAIRRRRGQPRTSLLALTVDAAERIPTVLDLVRSLDDTVGEVTVRRTDQGGYEISLPVSYDRSDTVTAAAAGVEGVTAAEPPEE